MKHSLFRFTRLTLAFLAGGPLGFSAFPAQARHPASQVREARRIIVYQTTFGQEALPPAPPSETSLGSPA